MDSLTQLLKTKIWFLPLTEKYIIHPSYLLFTRTAATSHILSTNATTYPQFTTKYIPTYLLSPQTTTFNPTSILPAPTSLNLLIPKFPYVKFFLLQQIDTPLFFKKLHSLGRWNSHFVYIKLINLLMKCGLREQIQRTLISSYFSLFTPFIEKLEQSNKYNINFTPLLLFFKTLLLSYPTFIYNFNSTQPPITALIAYFLQTQFNQIHTNFFFKLLLSRKIQQTQVIFSFFLKKINKYIWKYTRGKSGKHTLSWKYIPAYKRSLVAIRHLLPDLNTTASYQWKYRLELLLKNFLFNTETTFLAYVRKFTYNYMFQKYKKKMFLVSGSLA